VRHPTTVHDLGEDTTAIDMHGVGDQLPSLHLVVGVQTGTA
jgi:hypothetical protein